MHAVFALLCFVVVIHWLIFPYPSGLLHWHCGNLTIAPVPAKQPWWIWINTSCEFIMNDCITTTKQSTTKPCIFLGIYCIVSFLSLKPGPYPTLINLILYHFDSLLLMLFSHLPPDKLAITSQAIFSDAFLWMKYFVFWLKFHWSLFLRVQLTIG